MPNTEQRIPNTEHRIPNPERRIPNPEYRTPSADNRQSGPLPGRTLRLASTRYGISDGNPKNDPRAASNEAGLAVASRLPSKEDVSNVSTRLRRARERRGLRIEDISARTKIKPSFLHGIELGNYEALPGHFFTRAFIRSYAREVGLPPDELVRDYDRRHPAEAPPLAEIAAAVEAHQQAHPSEPPDWREPSTPTGRGWQAAAVVALAVGALMFLNRSEVPAGTSAATVAGGANKVAAVGTTGTEPVPAKLTMEIRPAGTIWVAATADGATAIYKLLQAGQRVTIEGREFSFRIGNAAAFDYSINGRHGKTLGAPDEVREFVVTTANYRDYLR